MRGDAIEAPASPVKQAKSTNPLLLLLDEVCEEGVVQSLRGIVCEVSTVHVSDISVLRKHCILFTKGNPRRSGGVFATRAYWIHI